MNNNYITTILKHKVTDYYVDFFVAKYSPVIQHYLNCIKQFK